MAQETKAAIQVKLRKLTPTATPLSTVIISCWILGTIFVLRIGSISCIGNDRPLQSSSGDYALSLDVKGDANQTDPKGFEPVDVAKEFVKALIVDDRGVIERLVRNGKQLLDFIYKDENTRLMAIERAKQIEPESWKQTYHDGGGATITAQIKDPKLGIINIGFELSELEFYGQSRGRFWYLHVFY